MATIIGAGLAMADEPMGRSVNNDERALAQQLHHEHSRAQFLQGVMARDGDHDGIRADRFFLQAAESARLAGDQPLSGALRLAAKHALHHLQRTFAHGKPVEGVEFTRDKSRLLSWDTSGTIRLWDISKDEPLGSFQCGKGLVGVAFSPDESRFLSWGWSGKARLWNVSKAEPIRVFTAKENAIIGAAFGKTGTPIFTWGHYHVQVWDPMQDEAIRTFEKSRNPIMGIEFNEDETLAFVRDYDNLMLWDVEQGKPVRSINNGRSLRAAVFNRKGDRVLTSYSVLFKPNRLALWDVDRDDPIWTSQVKDLIRPFAFSRDETRILAATYTHADQTTRVGLWSGNPMRPIQSYAHRPGLIRDATLSDDERRIISWDDHDVWVWDTKRKEIVCRLRHDYRIEGVSISRDARRLLAWTSDFAVRVWDTEQEKALFTFKHHGAVRGAAFNQDESSVVSWCQDGNVRLWSLDPLQPIYSFERSTRHSYSKLGPGKHHFLRWPRNGQTTELWNVSRDNPVRTFKSDFVVHGAATNNQATYVLVIGKKDKDDEVWRSQLWDVERNRLVRTIEALQPGTLAVNHDGTRCVTSQSSGADVAPFITDVTLWDISREKAKPIHSLSIDDNDPLAILNAVFDGETARYVGTCYDNYYVCDLAKKIPVWRFSQPFDPGGRFLGINQNITKALSWKRSDEKPQDSAILLWEMPKAKPVKTFPNEKEVGGAVFTKDETQFLTWRRDGTVDLWDVARKQPLRTFRCAAETAGAVFNNDATRFLAWNNSGYYDYSPRSVQLWDIAEGRLLGEFRHDAAVRGAMFHPNEDFIVSWGDDNTVRLWNVFAPEPLLKLSHDPNRSIEPVMRCDFDQTGDRIVAQDREGSLKVWDISWSSLLGTR